MLSFHLSINVIIIVVSLKSWICAQSLCFNNCETPCTDSDLTAMQRQAAVSTIHMQHPAKLLTSNPAVCFLEVDKAPVDVFGIFPGFLKNLPES